jgi:hypothetical protein
MTELILLGIVGLFMVAEMNIALYFMGKCRKEESNE